MRRWHHQLTHLHIHIDWSRNVSWKFAKPKSVITYVSTDFHQVCTVFFEIFYSSEIKLNLFRVSPLKLCHRSPNFNYGDSKPHSNLNMGAYLQGKGMNPSFRFHYPPPQSMTDLVPKTPSCSYLKASNIRNCRRLFQWFWFVHYCPSRKILFGTILSKHHIRVTWSTTERKKKKTNCYNTWAIYDSVIHNEKGVLS